MVGLHFGQGAFTHWYPYQFLDIIRLGFADSLRNALFVLLVGAVLACVANPITNIIQESGLAWRIDW